MVVVFGGGIRKVKGGGDFRGIMYLTSSPLSSCQILCLRGERLVSLTETLLNEIKQAHVFIQ